MRCAAFHSRPSRARGAGLTLVEMCLALGVLGIVAASIATTFIAASDIVEKGRSKTELMQAGRAAMNRLLAELRTATAIEERADNYLRVYCQGETVAGSFAHRVEFWIDEQTLIRQVEGQDAQVLAENVQTLSTGGLTLWSQLDDALDVLYPQVGPGGSVLGSANWQHVYFGNGFSSEAWSGARVSFPTADVLNTECGTIEFWLEPQFSAVWLGEDKDKYLVEAASGGAEFRLYFDRSAEQIKAKVRGKEVKWEATWAPSAVVHVALAWDCTGTRLPGGRTVALFVDSELCEQSAQTGKWTAESFGSSFTLGEYDMYSAEAAFDNLRVYDYCKTDFRDRYLEDALGVMQVELVLVDDEGQTLTIKSAVTVR
jgi:type II secretory pathway pseudopilin PulG